MDEKKKPATGTRSGRKPAAEKDSTGKRAEAKAKAQNLNPAVYVQYQETEAEIGALIEAAKADFKTRKKRTPITDLKLYVKPEERAAYYVVNDNDGEDFTGKITF